MSGDKHIEAQPTPQAANQNADHNKLLDDTSFSKYLTGTSQTSSDNALTGLMTNSGVRSLYAVGEGLTEAPHSAWNYAGDLWHHPTKLLEQAGIGLAFGVGLRVLLPEAGAAKALVGTIMGVGMLKDAALPVAKTVQLAMGAKNMDQVHQAAQITGDGMGQFLVNSGVAMVPGIAGEKLTGMALKGTTTGRAWEDWKTTTFNSDETAVGRFFTGSAKFADTTADALARSSDALNARLVGAEPPRATPLGIDEKLARIQKTQVGAVGDVPDGEIPAAVTQHRFDLPELTASGKRFRGLPDEVDTLLGDHTRVAEGHPDVVVTTDAQELARMQTPWTARGRKGIAGPTDPENFTGGTADGDALKGKKTEKTPAPADTTPPPGDATAKPTDQTTDPKAAAQKDAEALRKMAISTRTAVGKVSKEDIAVAQVREDFQGPLTSTMRSGEAPLDADHFTNNQMLIALARQLRNAGDVRQAGMLLDHYRTANQQLELAKSGDPGPLAAITDMNLYTRRLHGYMIGRMKALGINPAEVLRSTNSPLFTIRDSGGAGHYTIPAIEGVTDAPVITYAREYQGLEGVIVSGVDTHESGHNYAYRDMLRFPGELREKILTEDVVSTALKSKGMDPDQMLEVPGAPGDKMKLSEFLVTMLKAQANENTADIYAMSMDPNTGYALINLLASLRKPSPTDMTGPGLLETRSVYGKDMVDTEMGNNIGIEPHGLDRFRIKMAAQIMREGANGNTGLIGEADRLDVLADSMSRPGTQYVWANADDPGKFVAVPQQAVDSLIPFLVKAQLDTPLEALKDSSGKLHSWREIMPDLGQIHQRIDNLSTMMSDAAIKGKSTIPTFDKTQYGIEDVFSAGLSGWKKAIQQNAENGGKLTSDQLLTRILKLSENLRSQYRNDIPELQQSKTPLVNVQDIAIKPMSFALDMTSRAARAQSGMRNFFDKYAVPLGSAAGAEYLTTPLDAWRRDYENQQQIKDQMKQ